MAEKINTSDNTKLNLETAMKRLDEVVTALSGDNVRLEDALSLYEEGVALVRACNLQLDDAERKIKLLRMSDDGEVVEDDFDSSAI